MNVFSFLYIVLISGIVYAQELLQGADVVDPLVSNDPLYSMIAGGGITLPSAIVISAFMLSKWKPTIRLELKPVRIISDDRSRGDE
jgi:hypothetical protein